MRLGAELYAISRLALSHLVRGDTHRSAPASRGARDRAYPCHAACMVVCLSNKYRISQKPSGKLTQRAFSFRPLSQNNESAYFLLFLTRITRGLTASAFGSVSVRMPSSKVASILSASTGIFSCNVRTKVP